MNKKVFGRKLSRSRRSREALFSGLARAMIINGKIVTTRAKAKAVQGSLEKFVTLAKKGEISGRRWILANLDNSKEAVEALFKKVAPVFSTRNSGFTRIIALPTRRGDNAKMVKVEWTEKIGVSEKPLAGNKKIKKEKTEKVGKVAKKTVL